MSRTSQLPRSNQNVPQSNTSQDKEFTPFDDLIKQLDTKLNINYKFSNSSLSNLSKNAKKLKKELGIKYKEALDKASIKEGFLSYKDFRNQFNYWKDLSTTYIYVSKDEKIYYTKDIYTRLPDDDVSKSMDELTKDSNRERIDWNNSLSEPNNPVNMLNNYKFGIKLLTKEEKENFFLTFKNKSTFEYERINKKEDFVFKFIHYKFDPKDKDTIVLNLKKSSEKYKYKFSKSDVITKITELIDKQLYSLLNIETSTYNTKVYESYSVSPKAYIVNGVYFSTDVIYDMPFDDFSASKSDY